MESWRKGMARTASDCIISNIDAKASKGMKRVCTNFVPHLLTDDQRQRRISASSEMLEATKEDAKFLKRLITGDESLLYSYDPEKSLRAQSGRAPPHPH